VSGIFAAALSAHPVTEVAVGEVVGEVLERSGPAPDVAVITSTAHHLPHMDDIRTAVQTMVGARALIGASAAGVLGCGQGRELEPGLTLWTASFDHLEIPPRSLSLSLEPTRDGAAGVVGLEDDDVTSSDALILIVDPWTFPTPAFIDHMTHRHPHLRIIGGFASAGQSPGRERLMTERGVYDNGAVGLLLPPGALVATVVSQGCRPIGQPWTVTASHANVLEQLGGQPALDRLRDLLGTVSPTDRALAMNGLHCGLLAHDQALDPDRGDFLVRGIMAIDAERRTITVGAEVPVGSVVQFHVRDAATAGHDLARQLQGALGTHPGPDHAAVVFTCNGRGRAMFDTPHHDAQVVQSVVGHDAVGMMCAGEIGPVAGGTHLHGFTASVALF
jgi:small ligand-binding sensory domain FIST